MDDNVENCPVCLTTFDDSLMRPRNLPCGHTFCSSCINGLKEQGSIKCPTCRVSHAVPEAGEFPISYALEGLLTRLRSAGLASFLTEPGKQTLPVIQLAPKMTMELSKRAQSLLQEQEVKILAVIRSYKEEQSQLADYLKILHAWGGKLQTPMDQINNAQELLCCEESRVEGRKEEVRRREEALHAMLQAMRTAATRQEVYEVIENSDHLMEEEREKEGMGVFPDVHTVTTVARVTKACHAIVGAATLTAGAAGTATEHSSPPAALAAASSIKERIQVLLAPPLTAEKLPTRPLLAKDLLSLTQLARGLLKAGLVFAVQNVKGNSRYARISLENGGLHLYSLKAQALPRRAVILQIAEVVPAAPPCKVFLDLQWNCNLGRRVVVNLPRDTPKGRQFALLCSGQLGVCYAGTTLSDVECRGQDGERVWGGDIKSCNGEGGAALLPRLDQGKYWESNKAGAVGWCWWDNTTRTTQFSITARGWENGGVWPGVFGEVVHGLDVVKEAVRKAPFDTVTVRECGMLLGLPLPSKKNVEQ